MGIAEIVAKMTARGIAITGQGFGGVPELSQTDVAAAMSGLNGPVYWYMRAKYCGDHSVIGDLIDGVAFQILGESMTGEVDVSAKTARGLATVAVMQALKGPICEHCRGTGNEYTSTKVKSCPACFGTGRRKMTKGASAKMAGVSRTAYTQQYGKVVDSAVARLEAMESQGFSHIRRRISSPK